MKPWALFFVILASTVVTTLGIAASDSLKGVGSGMFSQLIGFETSVCPSGMIEVKTATTFTCVDIFEASAGNDCLYRTPSSRMETEDNLSRPECIAQSDGSLPWTYIAREQAVLACVRAGKRLPTAEEWYQLALGTTAQDCLVKESSKSPGNKNANCISAVGVNHTVGNVWEWVSDDVIDGVYNERQLPTSGYIESVDNAGVATMATTTAATSTTFPGYFWSNQAGAFGMMRGGYYGSRDDAGLYSLKAETPVAFSGVAVGFRCVR